MTDSTCSTSHPATRAASHHEDSTPLNTSPQNGTPRQSTADPGISLKTFSSIRNVFQCLFTAASNTTLWQSLLPTTVRCLSPTKYSHMKFQENLAAAELLHADGHVRKFLRSRLKIKLKYSTSTLCCSAQPPNHSAFLAHHFSSQQQLNQTTARAQSIDCMEDSTGDRRQASYWAPAHPPQQGAATPEEVHLTK